MNLAITVTIKEPNEVLIDSPVPLPSTEAGQAWEAISRELLVYAFAGRAACIIADDYRASDQGYFEFVEHRDEIMVDGLLYQIGASENCSPDALKAIVGTSDIWWDAVLIAGFSKYDESRIIKNVRAYLKAHSLKADKIETEDELLISTGDGSGFRWVNPSKPVSEIIAKVTHFAQSVGWNTNV